MKRVIVLGGSGWFGRSIVEQLKQLGIDAVPASRGAGSRLRIDAEKAESLRSSLRKGDLVIDATGPFHTRSTALLNAAMEIGCDLIDINDDLVYAQQVAALEPRIESAGIRVLSSASTVSAVAAAMVRQSGIAAPVRVSGFLAPAARHSANAGAALSLLRSVGRSISVWRDGRWQSAFGWTEPRRFAMPRPVGPVTGRLFETADALWLPRIWPSLREVDVRVDARAPGANRLLQLAGKSNRFHRLVERQVHWGAWLCRKLGRTAGGVGYEIENSRRDVRRFALVSKESSYLSAIAPAVLAAQAIVEDRYPRHGLITPERHVEPADLFRYLEGLGIHRVDA
jgi:hypothetical protein